MTENTEENSRQLIDLKQSDLEELSKGKRCLVKYGNRVLSGFFRETIPSMPNAEGYQFIGQDVRRGEIYKITSLFPTDNVPSLTINRTDGFVSQSNNPRFHGLFISGGMPKVYRQADEGYGALNHSLQIE